MKTLALATLAAALLLVDGALAAGLELGAYGHPGSPNGGVYVSKTDTCRGAGLEVWGHPGPFSQFDC